MRHDLRFIIEMRLLAGVTLAGPLSLFLSISGNEGWLWFDDEIAVLRRLLISR